jgi:membrane-bound lytic murein transglycosylase A
LTHDGPASSGRRGPRWVVGCRVAVILLWFLAGCDAQEPPPSAEGDAVSLRVVTFDDLPGWTEDRIAEALPAIRATCKAVGAKPAAEWIGPQGLGGRAGDWQAACSAMGRLEPTDTALRQYFETGFAPFAVSDADGLFTGYYEPELVGSRTRSAAFPVALYRPPPDMVTADLADFRSDLKAETLVGRIVDGRLEPYHRRADIDSGALAGQGLELLWLADPIDAFFLQVQGSGRVNLAEGGSVRVGYAASNGHPHTAIGRILVERGEMTKEAATMQTVRQWLRDHPAEATALMQMNARYIFFREVEGGGPIGSLGVALTPGRSLAIDASLLPLGAPMWLDTTYPLGTPEAGRPLRRLMVAQDTGGAIKGAVRGDVYWGGGEAALQYAGPMKQQGRYYLLLPKAVAERMAGSP